MAQAFYRKWRSQDFGELVGQEHVTRTLLGALRTGRISHAYLFCGPRGTGKTSTARILAKAVNCLTSEGRGDPCNTCAMCLAITEGRAMDLIEMDAASNRGIDDIRELRDRVNFSPNEARYKVYIIDEVHQLTAAAFDALLKTLEEPPRHVIFVLATTEAHEVPATILSRCQRFDFRRISVAAATARLEHICAREDIAIDPAALQIIVRTAGGSLRDAENLLDQVASFYGDRIDVAQVRETLGIPDAELVRALVAQIVDRDISGGLHTINEVANRGEDLRHFGKQLVGYLRNVLLIKADADRWADLPAPELEELRELAGRVSLGEVARIIKAFSFSETKQDDLSSLPLELALVEALSGTGGESRVSGPGARVPGPESRVPSPESRVPSFGARVNGAEVRRVAPDRRGSSGAAQSMGSRPSAAPTPADRLHPAAATPADNGASPAVIDGVGTAAPVELVGAPPPGSQPIPAAEIGGTIFPTPAPPASNGASVDEARPHPRPLPRGEGAGSLPAGGGGDFLSSEACLPAGSSEGPIGEDTANPAPPAAAPASLSPPPSGEPEGPVPGPGERSLTVEDVRLSWADILDQLQPRDPRQRQVTALLRGDMCRIAEVRDGEIVLAFRYDIHRQKLEEADSRRFVEKSIATVLGVPLKIGCRPETDAAGPDKLETAAADPMVQAVIRQGGRLNRVT